MRIVVTGGAGFIGSHIVDALSARGDEVIVVDVLSPSAHDGPPEHLTDGVRYLWRDIADPEVWADVLGGTAAVCHQAAKVGLGVDPSDLTAYVGSNDLATAAMLQAFHARRWTGRVVLASSMVVYGEGRYECDEHGVVRPPPRSVADLDAGRFDPRCPHCGAALGAGTVPEDAPTDPRNVYAATKLHQEHLTESWARYSGASVCSLRYHNVYGSRMPADTPYAGVASIFRSQLAGGTAPTVFEDGGQLRDFVHVSDVARANLAALDRPGVEGAVNVASGRPLTLLGMAAALTAADGRDLDPVVTGRYRLGDVRHIVADPSRARTELDLVDTVPPDVGLGWFASDVLRRPAAVT